MKICNNCKKEHNGTGNKYCSITCQQEYQNKQKVELWLNGEHNGIRGKTATSRWIKKYLIDIRGENVKNVNGQKEMNIQEIYQLN